MRIKQSHGFLMLLSGYRSVVNLCGCWNNLSGLPDSFAVLLKWAWICLLCKWFEARKELWRTPHQGALPFKFSCLFNVSTFRSVVPPPHVPDDLTCTHATFCFTIPIVTKKDVENRNAKTNRRTKEGFMPFFAFSPREVGTNNWIWERSNRREPFSFLSGQISHKLN